MELEQEVQRIAKLGSWSDGEAKVVVAAWRRSGEARAAFGRRYSIPVHRLYLWIAKVGGKRERTARKGVAFHPVCVTGDESSTGEPIEIRLIRVPRGIAADELRAVLSALRV